MSQSKKLLLALLFFSTAGCGEFPLRKNNQQQFTACPAIGMHVCRELSPGIYFVDDAVPNKEGCGFSTEGTVDRSLCQGNTAFSELISGVKEADGKQISVTGTFGDWRGDPVVDCAPPLPGVSEPTFLETYLAGIGGFGIEHETIRMLAEFSSDDARQMDSVVFDEIPKGASVTLHGVFKYKTARPQCSSILDMHPSGKIILNLMEK